jgi:hypothetical protein
MEYVRQPTNGRSIGFEDAADDNAIGQHIEVVIVPLAGRARGGGAFEDQPGHYPSAST